MTNEPGELLLRGPMATPGYWRNPEATAAAFLDSWFRTGDLVRRDEEDYLYVVDRLKNMFFSGGENVYPAEIENILYELAAVSEAAVAPVPDERWGETGRAFVALKPDQAATEAELLDFCRARLARFKIPRQVIFVAALPKNDAGKINRLALKQS